MDEEIKIGDDLDVEINNKPAEKKVTRLEEEIKIEEESRKLNKDNIKNFEKSQKPKKSLKKKVIAWCLGASIFIGAAVGAAFGIKNKIDDNKYGNGRYAREIQTRYEQVDKNLHSRLYDVSPRYFFSDEFNVNYLRFDEKEQGADLKVFADQKHNTAGGINRDGQVCYTFNVLQEYYESLVNAEEGNNMLAYLDALNKVVETMTFDNYKESHHLSFLNTKYREIEKKDYDKINNLLNLDFENDNIVRQIGFLPYHIEVSNRIDDEETGITTYTYKLSGISYCETKTESKDKIKSGDNLLIASNYDKNHVKTYLRDIEFTSTLETSGLDSIMETRMFGDFLMYLDGVKTKDDIQVKTSYFQETNIFDEYMKMKETKNFKYQKPADLNIDEYINSTK